MMTVEEVKKIANCAQYHYNALHAYIARLERAGYEVETDEGEVLVYRPGGFNPINKD